ncbi:MAG: IS4 family transposase [Nitrospinota bacterium]|nr:IS4 family transposase [Nitrospinota bacterium]
MSKFSSVFSQILQIFSRHDFARAVMETNAERHAKGFTCWDQFVAMVFCQLGQAKSLREICGGLASSLGKLRHLGIQSAPNRSTLSYANEHRPWQLYENVFYQLLDRCQLLANGKKKFRFKNKLFSLDATVIKLCVELFDWAKYRQTKGAVKLHLLLDHDGYLPVFAHITEGLVHEVNVARDLSFPPGSIVAIDRGYWDYGLFSRWTDDGVYFVTRMKSNAVYDVIEQRAVPQDRAILGDCTIRLNSKKCRHTLRMIEVWDARNCKVVTLLTNHLGFGATTIADVYRDRWQIEIFFKTIKQNLKIKTFVGTSPNALLVQIWTALISILILKYLKLRSSFCWSMSNLVAMLRYNLFTHRDLWEWIDSPYEPPPVVAPTGQLVFDLR